MNLLKKKKIKYLWKGSGAIERMRMEWKWRPNYGVGEEIMIYYIILFILYIIMIII